MAGMTPYLIDEAAVLAVALALGLIGAGLLAVLALAALGWGVRRVFRDKGTM